MRREGSFTTCPKVVLSVGSSERTIFLNFFFPDDVDVCLFHGFCSLFGIPELLVALQRSVVVYEDIPLGTVEPHGYDATDLFAVELDRLTVVDAGADDRATSPVHDVGEETRCECGARPNEIHHNIYSLWV